MTDDTRLLRRFYPLVAYRRPCATSIRPLALMLPLSALLTQARP